MTGGSGVRRRWRLLAGSRFFRRRAWRRCANSAAGTSYIVSVIETAETDEAGRRFRQRKAQERVDEQET